MVSAVAVYAVAVGTTLDGPARVIASLVLVIVLTLVAALAGIGRDDIGLTHMRAGLRWGSAYGLPVAVVVFVLSLQNVDGSPFLDTRYGQMTGQEVFFAALVKIPIGTALFEEYVFRGLLLALLLRQTTPVWAVVVSSVLFGAWHVFPAFESGGGGPWHASYTIVPATLILTSLAGAFLGWLRIRSQSLVAPVLVHALVNSTALVSAHLAADRLG